MWLISKQYIKLLHANSIRLSRFLLKEKAEKSAPTYSPVNSGVMLYQPGLVFMFRKIAKIHILTW